MNLLEKIHIWLGIILGLVFIAISSSGAILLYKNQITNYLLNLEKNHNELKISEVLKEIDFNKQPRVIQVPTKDTPYYKISYFDKSTPSYFDTSLNRIDSSSFSWHTFLHNLHVALFLNEKVTGVLGIIFVFFIWIGWILFYKKRKRKLKKLSNSRNKMLWIHRKTTIFLTPILFISVITGIIIIYYAPVKGFLKTVLNQSEKAINIEKIDCSLSWHEYDFKKQIESISKSLQDAELIRIYLPKNSNEALKYRLKVPQEWHQNGRSYIYFNPCSNEIIYKKDARDAISSTTIMDRMYPIHTAYVGTVWYKLFVFISALAPILLFISGLILLKSRKKKKN